MTEMQLFGLGCLTGFILCSIHYYYNIGSRNSMDRNHDFES